MKKPKLLRLRLVFGLVPGKSRRRGVAIITVLAIISLMTVLIISFFTMAQSQKTTAIGSVEIQRAITLKDTAINLVMAQIREATTLQSGGASIPIWTSGPGNIRTYHGSTEDLNRFYKLYSAQEMVIQGIHADALGGSGSSGTDALMDKIKKDIEPKWDQFPDVYVDINRPMLPAPTGNEEDNPNKVKGRLTYPIVDPSRYNGRESDSTLNTEGFSYGERSLDAARVNGVDPARGQLAMPVRWIYFLEDGTAGVVGQDGKFTKIGTSEGKPSKENPIVSRIAWWTDDETCKINVNTASLPIPWDTPHTNSVEDIWYAQHQPVNGECQHYPGHPAQTDLSAVLYPGCRYSPNETAMPLGMDPLSDITKALGKPEASLIWNISPFITETGGTEGGTKRVNLQSELPVALDSNDHLFATFEELYFKARREDQNLNRARETVSREDSGSKMLDRLEGSQFFLTTRSNGPEMTMWSTPRVCMFPLNEGVVNAVNNPKSAIPTKAGAYEVTMGANCTVAKLPYYFQRNASSGSRHNNFFADLPRNADMQTYLKRLTEAIPPGHPEYSTNFSTFAQKYPGVGAPKSTNGKLAWSSDNPNHPDYDSSDRAQILLSMLDYIRSMNMSPGYLSQNDAYGSSKGQVAGICGCNAKGNSDPQPAHTLILKYDSPYMTPKGSGRTYGPAELVMFAHVTTIKRGTTVTGVTPNTAGLRMTQAAMTKWQNAKNASLIQVGFMTNAFCPRQGWSPLWAHAGLNISNKNAVSVRDPRSAAGVAAPMVVAGSTPEYQCLTGLEPDGYDTQAADPPAGMIPWGGLVGARILAAGAKGGKTATLDPIVYEGPGAGNTTTTNFQLKWSGGDLLRIFFYDDAASIIPENITQGVDLDIGNNTIALDIGFTGQTIDTLMAKTTVFPPPKVGVMSFVVPHGDYRMTCIPLHVERGQFVPHGEEGSNKPGHSVVEPVLTGRSFAWVGGTGAKLAQGNDQLLADQASSPPLNPMPQVPEPGAYAPHLAPVQAKYMCNQEVGTKPGDGVIAVASSISPQRQLRFANGRRDGKWAGNKWFSTGGANGVPNRGSSDPLETRDFDNGVGLCPDGPYMNQPDDGDSRDPSYPYYGNLLVLPRSNPASFSPNRLIRCAVDFGSIPSGIQARVPWQTLRFRPDPEMNKAENQYKSVDFLPSKPRALGATREHFYPFSNYCGPKDHLLLDMFWVPVVEPWSISESFSTKGLINLNQQIYPFTYIRRTTALNALLRSERMMAIPDSASGDYKDSSKFNDTAVYRHWINAKETLKQLTDYRWRGQDPEQFSLPFNAFRSASEVCELWLVPEKNGHGAKDENSGQWNLQYIIKEFWEHHRLTGDNLLERPYANIYPRLTVRSNVYKVHIVAQTLKKVATNPEDEFTTEFKDNNDPDVVTAQWRGSALIERVINPNDTDMLKLPDYAIKFDACNSSSVPKLDNYYSYRVTEVKQMTD